MEHKRLLISGRTLYYQGFQGLDAHDLSAIDCSALYEVWWPQHVKNAQFNGDCDYAKVDPNDFKTEESVADYEMYGDTDTWYMLSWFSADFFNNHCH